jgi:hypothetical protein
MSKREYLKDKINEIETYRKNRNARDLCRRVNKFKKGYQPRYSFVNDENGDCLQISTIF